MDQKSVKWLEKRAVLKSRCPVRNLGAAAVAAVAGVAVVSMHLHHASGKGFKRDGAEVVAGSWVELTAKQPRLS